MCQRMVNSVVERATSPPTRNRHETMNSPQPLPMLDQSVTTSLRRPVELAAPFEWGEVSEHETKESLASLVRRFRPEIEAILHEQRDRSVA